MLDLTKPVQTRDGRPVRILCTDAPGIQQVVALIINHSVQHYFTNGTWRLAQEGPLDLVNIAEKIEGWINLYRDHKGGKIETGNIFFTSESEALKVARTNSRVFATAHILTTAYA